MIPVSLAALRRGALLLALLPSVGLAAVPTEIPTEVEFSNRDVNRIVCPDRVVDVLYSEEKGLTHKVVGENVFLKFLVKQEDGQELFAALPTEVYVICEAGTYALVGLPRKLPAQTVRLAAPVAKARENRRILAGKRWEEKLTFVARAMLTGDLPDSFTYREGGDGPRIRVRNQALTLAATVDVEGEGIQAVEYRLVPDEDLDLRETDFLVPELGRVSAILVDPLTVAAGEPVRVLVLRRAEER